MEQHAHTHPYGQNDPPQSLGSPHLQHAKENSPTVTIVRAGGFQQVPAATTVPERDWTYPAVLATFFFFPLGICAIIFLINAKFQLRAGDTEGARTSTVWARRLTLASYMAGTVGLVILLIVLYVSVWP
ncbi:uncharacterized protein LOC128178094 [Crassostrea angulata]|uniref:uncharacterized protein LOC128178094 n=1 Tax=Magallana angulata TaxID=2784310 RepID=UPI0022B10796|nr:uncharacterized protein LOC128178094 [Crassostrea angulata]